MSLSVGNTVWSLSGLFPKLGGPSSDKRLPDMECRWVSHVILLSAMLTASIQGMPAGSILKGPENATGTVGGTAKFTCEVKFNGIDALQWKHNETIIYAYDINRPDYPKGREKYLVTKVGSNFTLTVENLAFSDAGLYVCSMPQDFSKSYLTVLGVLQIGTNASNLVKGSKGFYTCEIRVGGPHMEDVSLRMLFDGHQITTAQSTNTDTANGYILSTHHEMILAPSQDGKQLSCEVSDKTGVLKRNSTTINVLYSASDISYNPRQNVYEVGETINCTAKGNPLPDVYWENMANPGFRTSGQGLRITAEMGGKNSWKCIAKNNIHGKPHQDFVIVDFEAVPVTISTTNELGQNNASVTIRNNQSHGNIGYWVWVVVVVFAVIIVLLILLVRHLYRGRSSDRETLRTLSRRISFLGRTAGKSRIEKLKQFGSGSDNTPTSDQEIGTPTNNQDEKGHLLSEGVDASNLARVKDTAKKFEPREKKTRHQEEKNPREKSVPVSTDKQPIASQPSVADQREPSDPENKPDTSELPGVRHCVAIFENNKEVSKQDGKRSMQRKEETKKARKDPAEQLTPPINGSIGSEDDEGNRPASAPSPRPDVIPSTGELSDVPPQMPLGAHEDRIQQDQNSGKNQDTATLLEEQPLNPAKRLSEKEKRKKRRETH